MRSVNVKYKNWKIIPKSGNKSGTKLADCKMPIMCSLRVRGFASEDGGPIPVKINVRENFKEPIS
jgi:hypothetical protein